MTEKTYTEWMEIAKSAEQEAEKAKKVELSQLREEFEEKLTAKGYTFADILKEGETKQKSISKTEEKINKDNYAQLTRKERLEIGRRRREDEVEADELANEFKITGSQVAGCTRMYDNEPPAEEAPSGEVS